MKKLPSNKNSMKNTKINVIEPETIPEIIPNKFLNEANIIVNDIIEKIISLSITTNIKIKIEKQIPSSCFDFLRNAIDSYLSLNFIFHDKEEINSLNSFEQKKEEIIDGIIPILKNENENEKNEISITQTEPSFEEQIFYNNNLNGDNNWDLMDEPLSNNYDRYATTLVKFKEIDKEKNYKINKKEILEEIDEENENNTLNENEKNMVENRTRNEKEGTLGKTIKLSNIYKEDLNNNNKNKKRNLNEIMSQFSYHDLDNDNDIYKEQENINYEKLRKELEKKENEQIEEKKNQKNAKREVENKMKLAVEKNRQYAGKKITVDSNGEIVFIKGIKLDKLNKDFILMKTGTKIIKDEENENEKNKSKKKKKKFNSSNTIDAINNINIEKKEEKEKILEKNTNENNIVEENNIEKTALKGRNQKLPKIKGNKTKNQEEIYKLKLLKRIEEGPIVLSGSNFDIMNMEVGVSIKEKEKFKSGGKDFYHKFNKYSMDNYNKQLKDTLHINSFIKTQIENENYNKSDMNNYLGSYTEGYNSSINFASNNSGLNQQTANSKNLMSNYNTLSNFGNVSITKSRQINSSLSPELKLSGIGVSLKGSMDKLNLITERQEKLAKKVKNIFKKHFFNSTTDKFILPKLEEINKFSSEILTSSDWMTKRGVNNTLGKPLRNPGKPGIQEIMRETGFNGKIFRERIKNNYIRAYNSTDTNYRK